MSDRQLLFCCPLCSVMPASGAAWSGAAHRGAFFEPMVIRARRSGRYMLQNSIRCTHGPKLPVMTETAEELSGPWNAWVEQAAREKAERLKFSENRTKLWLYWLGITPTHPLVENV